MRNTIMCLILGALSVKSLASPVYYTFQGAVSTVSSTDHSIFHPDASVQYVFLVDQDLPGIALHHSVAHPLADDPSLGVNFYYAEFISGTVEEVTNIEYGDKSYYGLERNVNGSITTTLSGSEDLVDGILFPDLRRNRISIYTESSIDSWFVGQTGFTGENLFPAWDGLHVLINSELTLSGISYSAFPAVPEPSSFALLFTGLILFITYSLVKKTGRRSFLVKRSYL